MDEKLIEEAVAKIRADLDWSGPGGKKMGHVVLERKCAEELRKWLDEIESLARSS